MIAADPHHAAAARWAALGSAFFSAVSGSLATLVLRSSWTHGDEPRIASMLTIASLSALLAGLLAAQQLRLRGLRSSLGWLLVGAAAGAAAYVAYAWQLL